MSMRYQGSVISATAPTTTPASGTGPGGTAPGIWTLEQQLQAKAANIWPRANGEDVYTSAGTFSWVCPAGVTSVSVVCIGSSGTWNNSGNYGLGGGGLGYKNSISVTPGTSYTLQVGSALSFTDSFFINSSTVKGGTSTNQNGGTYTGDGGGNGGNGGSGQAAGGGGAGGYSGTGGNGGSQGGSGSAAPSGGGGGGGAAGDLTYVFGGGGGGVGIYGQGASGAGGAYSNSSADYEPGGGRGGSGGSNGSFSNTNGAYGGAPYGGGFAGLRSGSSVSGGGSNGVVRIVYPGDQRTFPNNAPAS